jgi:hypothetical protein
MAHKQGDFCLRAAKAFSDSANQVSFFSLESLVTPVARICNPGV